MSEIIKTQLGRVVGTDGAEGPVFDPVIYTAVTEASNVFVCNIDSKSNANFSFTVSNTTSKIITFSNVPTGRCEVFLEITMSEDAAISFQLNSGASLKWSGYMPGLSSGNIYRFMFFTKNSGTKWDGYPSTGVAV